MLRKPCWFLSVLAWLILSSTGCQGWATVPTPEPNQPLRATPTTVHVVRRSGPPVTLDSALVRGDSLVGFVHEQPHTSLVAIPLAELSVVQVQKYNARKTLGLFVLLAGLGVLAYGAFVIIGLSSASD